MDLNRCLALVNESGGADSIGSPTAEEIDAILDFARAVAHASERKSAPLAAYAVGLAFGSLNPSQRAALLVRAAERIDSEAAAEAS